MIKVLVIDDSAMVRHILTTQLGKDPEIMVVGAAPDPYVAREMIAQFRPDVLTLDLEMPRMDGLTFLKHLMTHHPLPTIIVSSIALPQSEAALKGMELGAVDVVAKPSVAYSVEGLGADLIQKVKAASIAKVAPLVPAVEAAPVQINATSDHVIAIGASTGGTQAVAQILPVLPENTPAILLSLHMPPEFTRRFADRLNELCQMRVKEAEDGEEVVDGTIYVAKGDRHLLLVEIHGKKWISLKDGPKVCYHKPSVDVLFRSVAKTVGEEAIGVLLTGMGRDGATGLLEMKQAGACTVAQDEATSTVFGMPKEAIALGAADEVLPLQKIPEFLSRLLSRSLQPSS